MPKPKKNPGGRPPIENPRTETVRIRLTPDDLAVYREAASLAEQSWSDWVRAALDAYCKRKPRK